MALSNHWSASIRQSAPINLASRDQLWYSQDQLDELEERRMAYFQQHWQALRPQIGQQYHNPAVVSAVSYLKHVLLPALRQPGPADRAKLEMLDIIASNHRQQSSLPVSRLLGSNSLDVAISPRSSRLVGIGLVSSN